MAVAGHLEETSVGAAREPRRKLLFEAAGATASGATNSVLVHNISATGLLLESPAPLVVGEKIEIELPQAGATWAKVVWASGGLFGCQFHSPITPAALSAAQLRGSVGERLDIAARSDESLGLRIQRLRKERRLTLSRIAAELGVSKPTVWAWEQGKARPAAGRIEALAQVLGVAASELQPVRDAAGLHELLAKSREQIARALGINPEKIRILVEL
jgi:transcriptional regulator with XRE-family HTH domain